VIGRLRNHLNAFNLPDLFASNAADELVGMREELTTIYVADGAAAVRADLARRAQSWESGILNCWQTAMYHAAAASDWFCDGGFAEE
jgi:hypothetical protein